MKLPNRQQAYVPKEKITDYLLNLEHDEGGDKAAYFISRGFRVEEWEFFAEVLREHGRSFDVTETRPDNFGTRYPIEGPLRLPGGARTRLTIRSVWMIDAGKKAPRLISAYAVTP